MDKKLFVLLGLLIIFVISAVLYLDPFNWRTTSEEWTQDTEWKLESINEKNIDFDITLKQVDGELGMSVCNSIGFGKVKIKNGKIYFTEDNVTTLMACEEEFSAVETQILSILNKTMDYKIVGEKLTISDDKDTLVFKR